MAGVFGSTDAATEALATTDVRSPGYPWAVRTEHLALADASIEGIAVVTGMFASEAHADAFRAAAGGQGSRWRTRALASSDEATERMHERHREQEPDVVQIDAGDGTSVPGYAPEHLDRVYEEVDARKDWPSPKHALAAVRERVESLEPECDVASRTIHQVHGKDAIHPYGRRQWAPARCPDGREVFVPREATRVEAVVVPRDDGSARIVQVAGVECDTPTFTEQHYTRHGRRDLREAEPRLTGESDGCGAP